MLEIKNLSFSYGKNKKILDNINISVRDSEFLAVIGPNGVGKSTLFNCVLGLNKHYSGQIYLDGEAVHKMRAVDIAKKLAYVPQSHYPSFNYSVFDMVLMGTTSQVNGISSPGEKQMRLSENALERLGILHLKNRAYTQISGGERQLTLIARAIAQESRLIIMDEPTANLDYGNQFRVLSRIKELVSEGYTIVISTHNPDHAFLFANRTLALHEGCVAADGTPAEVIKPGLVKKLYGIEVRIQADTNNIYTCVPIIN